MLSKDKSSAFRFGLGMLLAGAAGLWGSPAFAAGAAKPAFQITEVNNGSFAAFGPFAMSLSEGKNPKAASVYYRHNMFSSMMTAPHQYDLGQHIRRFMDCYDILDGSVCDSYWDGNPNYAEKWRYEMLYYTPEVTGVTDSVSSDENTAILLRIDENGDGVGYRVNKSEYNTEYNYYRREGVARFNGKTFILQNPLGWGDNPEAYKEVGGYATALSFLPLEDGRILVGGYSSFGNYDGNIKKFISHCYHGNWEAGGDYRICPGFRTQATVWLIDPEKMKDGEVIIGTQAKGYIDIGSSENSLSTAAIMDLVKLDDRIVAAGYSATDDFGSGASTANTSCVWDVTIDGDNLSLGDRCWEITGMSRPGNNDDENMYTWVQAINKKGVILANRKMNKSKNSNRPLDFGISAYSADHNFPRITFPATDYPFRGANAEGSDINSYSVVVGWGDNPADKKPVNYAVDRAQTGFIYTDQDRSFNYVNDYICGRNEKGEADCLQNGGYYYVEWPVAINDEGIILASAFRYETESDWENYQNAVPVTVMLTPDTGVFVIDEAKGTATLNHDREVTYPDTLKSYTSKSSHTRGSLSMFWLAVLAAAGFCIRKKKGE